MTYLEKIIDFRTRMKELYLDTGLEFFIKSDSEIMTDEFSLYINDDHKFYVYSSLGLYTSNIESVNIKFNNNILYKLTHTEKVNDWSTYIEETLNQDKQLKIKMLSL